MNKEVIIDIENPKDNDLISKQAVIERLKKEGKILYTTKGLNYLIRAIDALPPVKQKSKWIPVSEGLPEDGTYLVAVERIVGESRIDIKSFTKDLNKIDGFNFPKHKCGWYDYDREYGYWEDINVIAWMPLPIPYEPKESEEV